MALADTQSTFHPLPPRQGPPSRAVMILMKAAWLQAVRRNELWVLLLLLGIYALAALVLRIVGIDSAQTARFVLGLGLQLGSLLSTLLVVVLGARALPPEFEQRTIYPILAKPVSRGQLLLGKALPVWLLGVGAQILFVIAASLIVPHLPYQDPLVLAQALVLKSAALALFTSLALAASLFVPVGVALLVCAGLSLAGGMAGNLMAQLWRPLGALLPDVALLDHFGRYCDGGAVLSPSAMAGLLMYALLWTAAAGWLARTRFQRLAL